LGAKLDRIGADLEKARRKRAEWDAKVKDLERRYREEENSEIHELVHAANLNPDYYDTRVVYVEYRKAGYSRKFFEEHRQEITIHKAAKKAFDELNLTKLPSRKSLYEEFYQLTAQKKKDYAEYRQVRKEKEELLIAKQTVETILNIDKRKEQEQEKENSKKTSR